MSVFDGKRNPDGILTPNGTTIVNGTASPNSVNVGRDYTMLEIDIAIAGGTPTGQFFLQKRAEPAMGPAGPTRLASDLGVWVIVSDQNNSANGVVLSSSGNLTTTMRVAYPRGEYQVIPGGTTPSGTWGCSYTLTGELR